MKKIKFPTAQTILLIICAFSALLTWLIPAGKYDTLVFDSEKGVFNQIGLTKTTQLEASQSTLEELNVKIPIEKFTSGDIYKPIAIPGTYKEVTANPQGPIEFIMAPVKGIIQGADIIFLVLIIGGLIGIMNKTGAFDAGISKMANSLKGHEYVLIILVTTLVSIGGTTFGLAEETIAFYPILIPMFLAAKYDAMVPLAAIYLGTSIGTMCSTINPFSTIIASDSAGISWTTGLIPRAIFWVIGTTICILYILKYAKKVKNDPQLSIISDQREEISSLFAIKSTSDLKLTPRLLLILAVFALCFIIMILGVSIFGWWFEEMTAIFLAGAIIIGFISKMKEAEFVETFVKGASDLLGVALIIGIARGVSVLLDEGLVSDTLLYHASNVTGGMNKGVFANVMLFIYSGLSFFIPSSSGMAVLTMPIMSPLADNVGFGREVIVNCYQYGMGLFAFINPTGLILASLAIVKVGFDRWLKFCLPLLFILMIITMLWLIASIYLF
ncbi:YfcC family protein [Mangrovimonas futianensis]|uniref:YfcC family protein n=1 Tax=Mangrovimonas futianensis TaxID=2895523 RepID=UPI001E4F8461|nr:YfcC family protein [Mangrovimonas futianensis]MCF1422050.1 YfcC family protein [Mangrovimonas futianensis]